MNRRQLARRRARSTTVWVAAGSAALTAGLAGVLHRAPSTAVDPAPVSDTASVASDTADDSYYEDDRVASASTAAPAATDAAPADVSGGS
jgi:hypothetical protein